MKDLIRFERVGHHYPGSDGVLNRVSFSVAPGEMVFITGPSGAGKSTLLRLVAALERPSEGSVSVSGIETSSLRERDLPLFRRQIGIVFQDFRLLPERTVFDNVAMPLLIRGQSGQDIGRRVRAALDVVGLRGKERALPLSLSGGEQQRVGIARAVVARPRLLIADEPTGNLDPTLAAEVMLLFRRFNQAGVGVLVATHALSLVERLPGRVLRIAGGNVSELRQAPVAETETGA
jgi:cell division transport system ATP-binding protein